MQASDRSKSGKEEKWFQPMQHDLFIQNQAVALIEAQAIENASPARAVTEVVAATLVRIRKNDPYSAVVLSERTNVQAPSAIDF